MPTLLLFLSLLSLDGRMAITVDDLPAVCTCDDLDSHRQLTRDLVGALTAAGVPAIGFVNEDKLDGDGDGEADPSRIALLEMWLDAGLELGNHTYSHPDLHDLTVDRFAEEIVRGERVTRRLLADRDQELTYFRHPFLHTGRSREIRDGVEEVLESRSYRVAPVTIDNSDYIFARAYDRALDRDDRDAAGRVVEAYVPSMLDKVRYYRKLSERLFDRDIAHVLLLHANRLNAAAVSTLATAIEREGYAFVPLSEALEDPAYGSADDYFGPAGISWLQRWAITADRGRELFPEEPETPAWILEMAGFASE